MEPHAAKLSVFVVGTRAQLIKVAPVIVCCESAGQDVLLLLSGQHKETMQDLVAEFGIRSRQETAVTVSERSTVWSLLQWAPTAYCGLRRRLRELRKQYLEVNVVVHGDTLSTVLGALAAKSAGVKVCHLESGLSSGKLLDPFPEELTRRIVFRIADVALCPDTMTADYMRHRYRCQVVDTAGNTIVDAVMMAARQDSWMPGGADSRPYLVVSLHRFQNIFDSKRLHFLAHLIEVLAARYRIHFVLHPATRKRLESEGLLSRLSSTPNVNLSPRLGYQEFLRLASGAACVLTDGGSNQEELAVLGVPTVIMRRHTERLDGLGQNAIMEEGLGRGIVDYLLEGRFEALRRRSLVGNRFGPSQTVASFLA
jgi:UDP-N-acetylglucosamine 2-epimerase (non-hydrolysing)